MTDISKEELDRRNRYRNVFSTPHGKVVLADILLELRFFQEIKTEEDKFLSNYAKRLLHLCGGWSCELAKQKD